MVIRVWILLCPFVDHGMIDVSSVLCLVYGMVIDAEHSVMSVNDTRVRIEQGQLLMGVVDKQTVGNTPGSLIHVIWNEHGFEATRQFLAECQKVVNYFLMHYGFSVGIGDTIAPHSTLDKIESTIANAKREVSGLIKKARAGKLERQPGSTNLESFENQVMVPPLSLLFVCHYHGEGVVLMIGEWCAKQSS
jgi:DNA-directed RNA polymerase beta' subunit